MSDPTPMYRAPNVITDDDHGPYITVVTATLMCWTVLTLLMRVMIRFRFNGPWGIDDSITGVGTVVAVANSIAIFIAVNQGLGRRTALLSPADQTHVAKSLFAGQILYIAAMVLSKVSTALLIARLTRVRMHKLATGVVSVISGVWGTASILAIALRCDLSAPWSFTNGAQCVSPYGRWLGIEIVSMLIELLLFGLAVFLVWGLQMSRQLKFIVVVAFLCRPLVIVTLGVRLYYIRPVFFNQDPFFNVVNASILTQVCMHYALIAATIPCTKPFIKAFHSGFMDPEGYTAGSHAGTKNQQSANGLGSSTHADDRDATRSGGTGNSLFINTKNAPQRPTNYATSTHPLTSQDSHSVLSPSAGDAKKSSDSLGDAPAFPLRRLSSENSSRPRVVAPPVSIQRLKHQSGSPSDPSSPIGMFEQNAGVVQTTIEHDPYNRQAQGMQSGSGRRNGQGSQEDVMGSNRGGLMIRQTREYEISYEPA